ncbi:TPA: hypothetical protein EYP66_12595 [Candidatus Poribacteria bacterium]|nr:hypothetical protein [Candidatus Poribacteria bacterium]
MARRVRETQAEEWQAWAKRYDIDDGIRTFESGLTWKVIFGALFIGLIMMPGSIYLQLISGEFSGGAAAPWVAVILFTELARRSFTTAKRQELYILLGLAGAAVAAGGRYTGYIWNAYLIQTPQAENFEIADKIPRWVVPPKDSIAIATRSLLHSDWSLPITVMLINLVLSQLRGIGGPYLMFRLTADLERLPFPMAPVSAQGATALAETTGKEETWRWRVFSLGSMAGLFWGGIYIGVPSLTGVMMSKPIQILPIPVIDFTQSIEGFAPTGIFALSTNFAMILSGFVMPFPVIITQFMGAVFTQFILNPQILYRAEILNLWKPGLDMRSTGLYNSLNFWFSFGIGKSFAFAVIGLAVATPMFVKFREARQKEVGERGSLQTPPGRGDFPIWLAIGMWVVGMAGYIYLIHWMIPNFPLIFLLGLGFIYTPIDSYINARAFGILSRRLFQVPYVRESFIIVSRYEEIDIWFAPFPIEDYGAGTQHWRVLELTGTRFTSDIAARLITLPILLVSGILVWHFIWKLAPIPSAQYPYVQYFWPINATNQCLWVTALRDGRGQMIQAIRGTYVSAGLGSSLGLYGLMWLIFPGKSMYFYGLLGGIGEDPGRLIPLLIGALVGRFYMIKKFGLKRWFMFNPVLAAGFTCGTGLVGMATVAIALLSKAVIVTQF